MKVQRIDTAVTYSITGLTETEMTVLLRMVETCSVGAEEQLLKTYLNDCTSMSRAQAEVAIDNIYKVIVGGDNDE